jgi:aspartate kinase
VNKSIPVFVLNTFQPRHPGTKIVDIRTSKKVLKAIAFRKGVSVINIHSNRMLGAYGFLSRVFEIFNKYETSVDLVTTSEVSISLTIDDDSRLKDLIRELESIGTIDMQENMAIIALVGEGIKNTAGIAARFFGVLQGINIVMVSLGASEVNMSIVVTEKDAEKAVKLLHEEFFREVPDKELFV